VTAYFPKQEKKNGVIKITTPLASGRPPLDFFFFWQGSSGRRLSPACFVHSQLCLAEKPATDQLRTELLGQGKVSAS